MYTAQSDKARVPEFLAPFAKEFKKEHFHIHGGSYKNSAEDALFSVFQDQGNQLHQGAKHALKGGLLGLVTAAYYYSQYGGKKNQFLHTRAVLGKLKNTGKYPPFVIFGVLSGLSWWVIHDLTLCPHEKENSFRRYLWAHAFQGGLMLGTMYHPAAIGYGMIVGAFVGLLRDHTNSVKLPKNFMLYMPNWNQEKRRNLLRQDQQYQLSLRSVLHTNRVFHPI